MPIFELGLAIPVQSHVWKFGLDWLSLSRVIIWIFLGGRNPLLGGCMWPAMLIFGLGWAIPVKSHLCKFGSDWLSLSRVIVSTNIFQWGRNTLLGGVTFDLWCPFLKSDELFQSKVMGGNLVWIGWNRRYVNFEGDLRPPIRGGYMWPTMPSFELGRGCLDKSHMWKFGSDWLRLSRVIVRLNQMTGTRTRTKIFKERSRSSPIGELNNSYC